MAKYFLYDDAGAFVGSADTVPADVAYTDVDPKDTVSPTWDGKGWVAGSAYDRYAIFESLGYTSALNYAIAETTDLLANADVQVANSIPLQTTLDATAQTIVSIEGGTADQVKLDAFSTAMAKRTSDLGSLAASGVNLASAKDMKAVTAVVDEINAVLATL